MVQIDFILLKKSIFKEVWRIYQARKKCQVLSFPSVCSYYSKNSKRQTSVATWSQVKILLSRQQTVYPQDMRSGQTQRRGLDPSLRPFLHFCLLSLEPDWLCSMACAPIVRKGAYFSHQRFPLWSLDFLLWSLFVGFLTTILHSSFSYSDYLTEIKYIFKNYRSSKKKIKGKNNVVQFGQLS